MGGRRGMAPAAAVALLLAACAVVPARGGYTPRRLFYSPGAGGVGAQQYPLFDVECSRDAVFTGSRCSCATRVNAAKVQITNCRAGDILVEPSALASFNLRAEWAPTNTATGDRRCTLSISGTQDIEKYLYVISSVTFRTTATDLADRNFVFTLGDLTLWGGHYYSVQRFAPTSAEEGWGFAQCYCSDEARDYFGLIGYVVTTTSQEEMDYVVSIGGSGWLGATRGDLASWRWVVGPEGCPPYDKVGAPGAQCVRSGCDIGDQRVPGAACTGSQCDGGTEFWVGESGGMAAIGMYAAWAQNEPNNVGNIEKFIGFYLTSRWADFDGRTALSSSVVCEYGGVGEACVDLLHAEQTLTHNLDECDETISPTDCFTCAGTTCTAAAQDCVDPAPQTAMSLQNWQCICRSPFKGQALAAAAKCTCVPGVTGPTCQECEVGHIDYPNCNRCDVAVHCNSKAMGVTDDGMRTACVCQCNPGFTGDNCQCEARFALPLCDACVMGYINFPTCEQCSSATHCNNRATNVSSNALGTGCDCTCMAGYEGDCGRCAEGHVGYPSCRVCNPDTDCSGKAVSVTDDGTRTSCVCTCAVGFEGDACDACAPGYVGYPQCERCDIAVHCSGHAQAVNDDGRRKTCVCTCDAAYNGPTCDACAAGRVAYPTCRECSPAADCNGQATTATANAASTVCLCTCDTAWAGDACERCADGFAPYPQCALCTNADACNGNAASVGSNAMSTACECVCNPRYAGVDCSTCAEGFVGYPACTACTVDDHCNGRGTTVTDDGTRTTCVCECADRWTGPTCDACAPGFIAFPACDACDNEVHCGGRAVATTDDGTRGSCVCECDERWTGPACGACAAGFIMYPACTACSSDVHCSGHAAAVSDDGTRGTCMCECEAGWEGAACDVRAERTPTPLVLPAETVDAVEKAGKGAVVGSVLSGAGAATAGRLAMLRNIACEVDDVDLGFDVPLDFEFHPTGVAIGSGKDRFLVGAVIMNTVIVALFVILTIGVAKIVTRARSSSNIDVWLAYLRTPGCVMVPFMLLVPGTSLATARLLFTSEHHLTSVGARVLSGAILALLCASPMIILRFLWGVPQQAYLIDDPALAPKRTGPLWCATDEQPQRRALRGPLRVLYFWAFGNSIWVSRGKESYFCDAYGMLFDNYKEGLLYMQPVEVIVNVTLGLMSAWKPTSMLQCNLRNTFIALLFLGNTAALLARRPFLAPLDNTVAVIVSAMTFVAIAAMAIGIATDMGPESFLLELSAWCLLLSAILVIAKGVWDIALYIIDLWMHRRLDARRRARANAFAVVPSTSAKQKHSAAEPPADAGTSDSSDPSDASSGMSLAEVKDGVIVNVEVVPTFTKLRHTATPAPGGGGGALPRTPRGLLQPLSPMSMASIVSRGARGPQRERTSDDDEDKMTLSLSSVGLDSRQPPSPRRIVGFNVDPKSFGLLGQPPRKASAETARRRQQSGQSLQPDLQAGRSHDPLADTWNSVLRVKSPEPGVYTV